MYGVPEGPFQSDALLVPERCLFDHIHNQSVCQTFDEWNVTASHSCAERGLTLKSFAMLLPCGVDIFSGVEFVCCPAPAAPTTPEGTRDIRAVCYTVIATRRCPIGSTKDDYRSRVVNNTHTDV
ncbi:APLP2 [Cordylochernes scorpioides]|uniref:APLP2 n=1 Tax=Cordylochernes scorpioides TaxID=51811 RepID=A0ABY6KTE6_9ARAC|nr:APLP2 [Cordylochernes scorpioides]